MRFRPLCLGAWVSLAVLAAEPASEALRQEWRPAK
jgi:hypothetical protein